VLEGESVFQPPSHFSASGSRLQSFIGARETVWNPTVRKGKCLTYGLSLIIVAFFDLDDNFDCVESTEDEHTIG
jgi:hypothetical protein